MILYKGQKELSKYVRESKQPTLIGFVKRYKDCFAYWHEEKVSEKDLLALWTERFCLMYETINAKKLKQPKSNKSLKNLFKDISQDIELRYERKNTKRHLEIESLKTQRSIASASNKRLRKEIKSEASSLQSSKYSSQSCYNPSTDSDEDIDDLEPKWYLGEFDISEYLDAYRKQSRSIYLQFKPLSDLRKMSLNHIFLFDGKEDNKYDCGSPFPAVYLELLSDFNLNENFHQISNKEHALISQISYEMAIYRSDQAESIILEEINNTSTKICCKILFNLLQTYTRKVDLYAIDESAFINQALNPIIDVIFDYSSALSKAGNFTNLEGNSSIKPDIKYSALIRQHKMDFVVIEVKCPNSKAKNDLFKLSIEMQILLNRLVNFGINSPVVFGATVHGFRCDLFKMDLKAPTIYRMIKIRSCFIPRDLNDFDVLRNTIASFNQFRSLVLDEVERAKNSTSRLSNCLTWIRDPVIDYKASDNE